MTEKEKSERKNERKNEIIETESQNIADNGDNMTDNGNKVRLTFSEKEIETIKNTVAAEANDYELNMFLSLAKRYGLDPFNKEIFFWKYKGKPQIMTSRDGILKIADRHPQFDGLVSDVVREQDNFRRKSDGIDHEYGTDRGDIIGAYALVYRKDRKYPVYVFAPMNEYDANTHVWRQYPSAMILKCAESMALKRAFSVSGLVSREEMKVVHLQEEKDIAEDQDHINSEKDIVVADEEVIDTESTEKTKTTNRNKKNENAEITSREQEIIDIVDDCDELKKEILSYLNYIKEKNDLEKISLNDLSDDEFDELKNILFQIKSLLEKTA